jgi:hypothetical protein
VFDDFAVVIEPKNINACPIGVPWPLLITMQDHIVSFGNHPLKLDTLAWIVLCHLREVRDESLLAISNRGIMLEIGLSCVSLDCLGGLTLIEHQIIELRHRLLVAFQLLIHSEPGHVSMLSCFTLLHNTRYGICLYCPG